VKRDVSFFYENKCGKDAGGIRLTSKVFAKTSGLLSAIIYHKLKKMGQTCCKSANEIDKCDFENTPAFTLQDNIYTAKVIDIYDGDSVTCAFNIFDKYYKFNVRLAGIDTCELKSKNREQGLRARMRLYELVTGRDSVGIDINIARKNLRQKMKESKCLVTLRCGSFDKYGRLLGWLYNIEDIELQKSFNDTLVSEKHAYPYFGEKKLSDDEQIYCN
jgi:endonuclease YncB( thermonuclease family)